MNEPKDTKPDSGELRCSTFRVVGYAMIPVEIAIDVSNCSTPEEAMQSANECLEKFPQMMKGYIVPGTEDYGCVHSFLASRAEQLDT